MDATFDIFIANRTILRPLSKPEYQDCVYAVNFGALKSFDSTVAAKFLEKVQDGFWLNSAKMANKANCVFEFDGIGVEDTVFYAIRYPRGSNGDSMFCGSTATWLFSAKEVTDIWVSMLEVVSMNKLPKIALMSGASSYGGVETSGTSVVRNGVVVKPLFNGSDTALIQCNTSSRNRGVWVLNFSGGGLQVMSTFSINYVTDFHTQVSYFDMPPSSFNVVIFGNSRRLVESDYGLAPMIVRTCVIRSRLFHDHGVVFEGGPVVIKEISGFSNAAADSELLDSIAKYPTLESVEQAYYEPVAESTGRRNVLSDLSNAQDNETEPGNVVIDSSTGTEVHDEDEKRRLEAIKKFRARWKAAHYFSVNLEPSHYSANYGSLVALGGVSLPAGEDDIRVMGTKSDGTYKIILIEKVNAVAMSRILSTPYWSDAYAMVWTEPDFSDHTFVNGSVVEDQYKNRLAALSGGLLVLGSEEIRTWAAKLVGKFYQRTLTDFESRFLANSAEDEADKLWVALSQARSSSQMTGMLSFAADSSFESFLLNVVALSRLSYRNF